MSRQNFEEKPIVAFGVEDVLASPTPTLPTPGAAEALQSVRELGARSLAITRKAAPRTAALLQRIGLEVDEIHGDTDPKHSAQLLTELGAYAYIGSEASYIKTIQEAGILTVGLTFGQSASTLRQAGVDTTMDNLTTFQTWAKWTGLRYATAEDGRLAIEDASFRNLSLSLYTGSGNAAKRYLKHHQKEGQLDSRTYTTSDVAKLTGYSEMTIKRWASEDILHPIKVGGKFIYNRYQVHRITTVLDQLRSEGLTWEGVGEKLGMADVSVFQLVADGKLYPIKVLGIREMLYSPAEVASYKIFRERDFIPTLFARQILGVSEETLAGLEETGQLMHLHGRGYDPADIEELQRGQQKLNPPFEGWLTIGANARMYGPRQVARLFGRTAEAINRMGAAGILPFRTSSLGQHADARRHRIYPADYIDALVAFRESTTEGTLREKMIAFRELRRQDALAKAADPPDL